MYEAARGLTFRPGFQSSEVGEAQPASQGINSKMWGTTASAQREGLAGRTDREPRVCCLRSVWSLQPFFPVW